MRKEAREEGKKEETKRGMRKGRWEKKTDKGEEFFTFLTVQIAELIYR